MIGTKRIIVNPIYGCSTMLVGFGFHICMMTIIPVLVYLFKENRFRM
jgi:hypothetical protein